MASADARVVIADLKDHKAEAVPAEVAGRGAEALGLACDVRDTAQIAAVVDTAASRFGGIDTLVNAAIAPFKVQPLEGCSVEDMQDMLHSGLVGVTTFMQAAFLHLRDSGHGRIVNFGSGAQFAQLGQGSDDNPGMADVAVASTSVGRIGDCELDVGAAPVFLASGAAAYTTGHTLMVDDRQSHL